jgi:hypothetical protein
MTVKTSTDPGSKPSGREYVVGESAGGLEVMSHTAACRIPFPLGGLGYSGFA